jgi:hypothetical protein
MVSYEVFEGFEESKRFRILEEMISNLLEKDEYRDYSGDEIAAWSDENIIKAYNEAMAKDLLDDLEGNLESTKLEIQSCFNNPSFENAMNKAIECVANAKGCLEIE